jgi:hypothetical protein
MLPSQKLRVLKGMYKVKPSLPQTTEEYFRNRISTWNLDQMVDHKNNLQQWCNSLTIEEKEGDFKHNYNKRLLYIDILTQVINEK